MADKWSCSSYSNIGDRLPTLVSVDRYVDIEKSSPIFEVEEGEGFEDSA